MALDGHHSRFGLQEQSGHLHDDAEEGAAAELVRAAGRPARHPTDPVGQYQVFEHVHGEYRRGCRG